LAGILQLEKIFANAGRNESASPHSRTNMRMRSAPTPRAAVPPPDLKAQVAVHVPSLNIS
jgi:hypothetical protein